MKNIAVSLVIAVSLIPAASVLGSEPGMVIGWGQNSAGEATGIPNIGPANTLKQATNCVNVSGHFLTNIVSIAAGPGRSLALCADGSVYGWGENPEAATVPGDLKYPYLNNGRLAIGGRVLTNVVAIAAGRECCLALKKDGTVIAWGFLNSGKRMTAPENLRDVKSVAAGDDFGLALKENGTVIGWGSEMPPTGLSNVVVIAAGPNTSSLALKNDGTVIEWWRGAYSRNGIVVASNAIAMTTGGNHGLALQKDGTVFGWRSNGAGEATGIPTTEGNYQASGLVKLDGKTLDDVVDVAAGYGFSLALRKDGTITAWGRVVGRFPATVPPGLSNVVSIAVGPDYCLAITTNAAVAERFRH